MNKYLYFFINGLAVIIAIALILFGRMFLKVFALFGLLYIGREIFSGKYKKYIS